jgi:putative NADH-flavin reductase
VQVVGAGARAMVAALPAAGVRRVVLVSAAPLAPGGEGPFTRLVMKPVLLRLLRKAYDDLRDMEATMRASDLDWTVIRPPMLTGGPHTGRYRRAVNLAVRGGRTLSRADTADACLAALDDPTTVRQAVAAAY